MTVTEMISNAATAMEEINMDTTVRVITYECEVTLEDGDSYCEKWVIEDGQDEDQTLIVIEDWMEDTLEDEGWEVYEIEVTRHDANSWGMNAYDDYGDGIATATIKGDRF